MEICYSTEALAAYLEANVKADQEHPLLLDRFLENAIEVDVDALADGTDVYVAGIMQHVEEAGVHSGDSACVIPPMSLGEEMLEEIRATTRRIALELGVVGLINIQYGVAGGELYVIEANPRASRTVPFVSKAIGAPLAKIACRLMLGEGLSEQGLPAEHGDHVSVKEAVLPFARFAGADTVLGPEMKSTGEVMGIAADFPTAFGKAQAAAGVSLPLEGTVFITVTDTDKPAATQIAARFCDLGFEVVATAGTAQAISAMGVPVRRINKIAEGSPHVVDWIRNGEVRPGDQHADRLRRPRRRPGDPQRRGPPGASLPDDDDRRLGGGAGDLRPAGARGGGREPAGAARARQRESQRPGRGGGRVRRRTGPGALRAPRRCEVVDNHDLGRLPGLLAARLRGPGAAGRASSTCSRPRAGWAQRERAPVPAARLLGRRRRRRRPPGCGSTSWSRTSGPGPTASAGWQRASASGSTARSGGRSRPPGELSPGAAGAILVGGGIGVAPLAILRRQLAERGVATRILLGFRDQRALGRPRGPLRLLRGAAGLRGRPRRAPGLRHRPARGAAGGR